ncbi:MAG: hypothetical protein P4L85_19505 [Paludisphaera borealis]|uniref:hypothetical protein n=1 Tax=Paludisphaera borealis TaxID=1387353 RepID=UPI002847F986|nr:hypothetical protein [Paludisphaera borealis]MDR3621547.1 hypothetical protein [Paludisphaera borealis]
MAMAKGSVLGEAVAVCERLRDLIAQHRPRAGLFEVDGHPTLPGVRDYFERHGFQGLL